VDDVAVVVVVSVVVVASQGASICQQLQLVIPLHFFFELSPFRQTALTPPSKGQTVCRTYFNTTIAQSKTTISWPLLLHYK
jgi:hypothetical protein